MRLRKPALAATMVVASIGSSFAAAPAKKPPPAGPGCIYGQVMDGHSGTIRCLSPEEVTPPGPYDWPGPDAGADASGQDAAPDAALRRESGIDANTPIPLRPAGAGPRASEGSVSVSIEGLTFDSGDVPRAPAALDRIKKDFAKCGVEMGTLKGEATVELRFLVRAPGRAEGVDVVQSRGMSSDIVRCVASSLTGRPVGAPTSDPVGVSLTVRFKQEAAQGSKKD